MPKDVIPKEQHASEIVEANLLKNTFISKRHALRKNIVPSKYRNNLQSTIKQLHHERANLMADLNAATQRSNLIQDERDQQYIVKLHKQRSQVIAKYDHLKQNLFNLNKEIGLLSKDNYQKKKMKNTKLKEVKKPSPYTNVEEMLYTKTMLYNKGLKKQREMRTQLDNLLKEMWQKHKVYDLMISQLHKESQIIGNIGKTALEASQARKQARNNLMVFRNINEIEERQHEERMYMTRYKLKIDLELNEGLQLKHSLRQNNRIQMDNETVENLERTAKNNEAEAFLKQFTQIGGDIDLKEITNSIKKMDVDKDSLYELVLFLSELIVELENSIQSTQHIVTERILSNKKDQQRQICRMKKYMEEIQANDQTLKSTEELVNRLIDVYKESCDSNYDIFQTLRVDTACTERLDMNSPPNEGNILSYIKELERVSMELVIKVNCVENSCITELTEDPLTSDADSEQNLISKDYDGIEVKMHRVLNMEDQSMLPVSNRELNIGKMLTPCPFCIETHFVEDGYCDILPLGEMKIVQVNSHTKPLALCDGELIKYRDFKNMSADLAGVLHDRSHCKKKI